MPRGHEIYFATGNPKKVQEAQSICEPFGVYLRQQALKLREIQGDPQEVVRDKVTQAHDILAQPVIVNDSSWHIPALNGFPGAYMHDINEWFTAEDFTRLMHGIQDRRITLTDTVAYHDGVDIHLFNVQSEGTLASEPHGTSGAASDRVVSFHPEGKTIAECREAGLSMTSGTEQMWRQFAMHVGEIAIDVATS